MAVNPDDLRLGDVLQSGVPKTDKAMGVALLGFPYEEGVRRNGGRLGAKDGPATLRRLMKRMGTVINPEYDIDLNSIGLYDVGDINAELSLEEGHQQLRTKVSELLNLKGVIPFVVGGGNDQSYANGSALLDVCCSTQQKTEGIVGIVNIDAHLDVRPLKDGKTHSGSPFRQLLEDERFHGSHFVEFAAQGNQCSVVHAQYLKDQGGKIYWLSSLRNDTNNNSVTKTFEKVLDSLGENVFVSFDLDSVCGADAPGVSAVGTIGLTAQEALDMCFIAGKHPKVRLFDLSEFNPAVEDYRTGRLVANMFYFFSLGVASRLLKTQQ